MESDFFIRNKIVYDSMSIIVESVTKDEFQLNTLNECDNTMISIQLDGTVEKLVN
jgi:hypothetical protein